MTCHMTRITVSYRSDYEFTKYMAHILHISCLHGKIIDFLLLEFWTWCHQMETFSAILAICAGNSLVTGEFPAQRPGTRSLDVFFDLRLNKRLSKQLQGWWFETLSCPLWRHCNEKNGHVIERFSCMNTKQKHEEIHAMADLRFLLASKPLTLLLCLHQIWSD